MVRHGEVHNPEKVLYGRLPAFQLSERGRRQAEVTAKFLQGRDVAAIISSPLERAVQTANPIAEWYGLPVETDHRLIESSSVFQGRRVEQGPEILKHPYIWKHIVNPFRPSWGEAYVTVAARAVAAVQDARDAYPGREVVLVTHQLPVWMARRALEGRRLWHRPDRRQCALASVTSMIYEGAELGWIEYVEPNGPASAKYGSVGS
ncbi:MAG: histidine phosphatase family protein [Frankiaceae bacterium]|jgi:broad specificity phosphatase PhoE